jgi:hypothetical protein
MQVISILGRARRIRQFAVRGGRRLAVVELLNSAVEQLSAA